MAAPVPEDQPAARRPEAVKPGPERPRTARPAQEETPPPNPGDLVCGNCGIGNDPARRFCRRCGQSLATATVAPARRLPWYRRIFGLGRPKAKVAAGERPKSMRTDVATAGGIRPRRLLSAGFQVLVIAALVGAIAGYGLIPNWRATVNQMIGSIVEIFVPAADPVSTAGTATGDGLKDHPAQMAFDGKTSYWAAPFVDGKPPTFEASFTPPADISKLLVTAGASGDKFKTLARPREIKVDFLDAAGAVIASKSLELKEQPEAQPFDAGAKAAAKVRVQVLSIYVATADAPVAITEIEFFGRRQEAATPSPVP